MGPIDPDLPVVDHHCHLAPTGEGVEAARRFRALGGTHLFLCTQTYDGRPPRSVEGYAAQFETTEALGRQVRAQTGVRVHLVVAPFPVDLVDQVKTLGAPAALDLHRSAIDLAGRWVRDHRAVALGEVGRPHFPVEGETSAVAAEAFRYALAIAREVDCPAVVHSEDLDGDGFSALGALASEVGLPAHRVVKHYARNVVPLPERAGVAASYVARRETFAAALGDGVPYFFETDFLDDPRRPGAVLDLATIPRRVRACLAEDPAAAERLRAPFVESIARVYGFTPTTGEAAPP